MNDEFNEADYVRTDPIIIYTFITPTSGLYNVTYSDGTSDSIILKTGDIINNVIEYYLICKNNT